MVNLTHPELKEIQTPSLPGASLDALYAIRNRLCNSSGSDYTLQPQQKFLRRVLSPDSPTRNLLMVHGTGVGKTCTGIQIAEEYIMRPEFQDKKVLVVASRAVQENFRTQIFDMSRVNLDKTSDTLSSKQCTGRRYLDMLLRIEAEPKNWANPEIRSRLETTADRIIKEFYEFQAYNSFGARLNEKLTGTEADIDEAWVHENFDNRLIIIDEAHNITTQETEVARGLERLVKVANGLVLVLLTATPMYDTYEEIVFFMNLFLWNERKQPFKTILKASDFFTSSADLKGGESEIKFRQWCQDYVSYVKGESPFTFPFRLPPQHIASNTAMKVGFNGHDIPDTDRTKYLSLVESEPAGLQKKVLTTGKKEDDDSKRQAMMMPTISVFPDDKNFAQTFKVAGNQFSYAGEPFLTPAALPNYSSKFVSAIKSIESSSGVCLVYSNYVERGARLFAMALEEHGYTPHKGKTLMKKPSYEGNSKGKYILISSSASDAEISTMLDAVKNRANSTGKNVKVVVTSPLAAEGIDFRFVRQVHILDPWWNMSRIEQVVGRALRTCSHQDLVPKEQNCTVYLHIVRPEADREAFDEYTYRTKVEVKGIRIAKVRKIMAESAMDCPIQLSLPADWRELEVPQIRDEGHENVTYRLKGMMAPTFDESPDVEQCKVTPSEPEPDHVRPLSSYLDSRDEILTKVGRLFVDKSIWDREQLFSALRPFSREVTIYTLQQAISSAFRFVDAFGRSSLLESKGDLYALAPIDVPNSTLIERTTKPIKATEVPLPDAPPDEVAPPPTLADDILDKKRNEFKWPKDAATRFSEEVRNSYIFDHEFTPTEKRAYLATKPDLPFADRLYVPDSDIVVTGDEKDLVGEELTKYNEWVKALIDRFIADKGKLFASVAGNGALTLSLSEIVEDVPTRTIGAKSFMPTICSTGQNPVSKMKIIAKYIDVNGVGLAAGLAGAPLCVYTELLAREQHNIAWYTPEEMKVIGADVNKNAIKKGLKS
jgi:superfamily II DNA or RNA helicase